MKDMLVFQSRRKWEQNINHSNCPKQNAKTMTLETMDRMIGWKHFQHQMDWSGPLSLNTPATLAAVTNLVVLS
jgi:hypothetical protein